MREPRRKSGGCHPGRSSSAERGVSWLARSCSPGHRWALPSGRKLALTILYVRHRNPGFLTLPGALPMVVQHADESGRRRTLATAQKSLLTIQFGGTSVGDAERIRGGATGIIHRVRAQGHRVVVVTSAMAGVTNKLAGSVIQCHSQEDATFKSDR